ncbi:serine protease Do-like HtrA [bacterium BMS3Abin15]|nr:serine protease Do-like HtrA [bacterium BMS3Abin15]HDZ85185.1 PDZ domain-containing protein [Candidatus Moranbacteria bacterium]
MKVKKIIRFLLIIIFIFIIGGVSSVIVDRYIFPKLSATKFFSKFKFFQKANENVTIIEKTEQITVKEDDSVNEIASQAATAVVNIVSISDTGNQSGNGTGVIATSDGLIITYRDAVIKEEAKYKVLIFNGSSYDAELLGIDEFSGLAFLKINISNLPVMPFSNSSDSRPGKKLIAIGNSFGEYQNRFAAGLLSNINKTFNLSGKTLSSSEKLEGVFETDFNSQESYLGGPMIDYNGELIGIIGTVTIDNKQKYFQIPSNIVKKTMEAAIEGSLKERPYLGIYYVPITKAYAIANDLERDKGALIYSASGKQGLAIISGSPASKAGLKLNDVIIAIGEREINLDNPLSNILSEYKKGDEIELTVIRNGEGMSLKVQL